MSGIGTVDSGVVLAHAISGGEMHSIVLFLGKAHSFDAGMTRVVDQAFHWACRRLHDRGQPQLVREVIAERVIALAKNGERNADRLCASALASFGLEEGRTG
jgi:hypothetical protein